MSQRHFRSLHISELSVGHRRLDEGRRKLIPQVSLAPIAAEPAQPAAHFNFGLLLAETGHRGEVTDELRDALKLVCEQATTRVSRGGIPAPQGLWMIGRPLWPIRRNSGILES